MTSDDLLVPGLLGLTALGLVVLLVATLVTLRRERQRSRDALAQTRAEAEQLRRRVDDLARRVDTPDRPREDAGTDEREYVITDIGNETPPEPSAPARIEGSLFVDLVVRESVVKAAGLAHGLRRALAPETRNRIRFAMKQEVKRSRKARRIELRDVRRELAARRAAATTEQDDRTVGSEEGAA